MVKRHINILLILTLILILTTPVLAGNGYFYNAGSMINRGTIQNEGSFNNALGARFEATSGSLMANVGASAFENNGTFTNTTTFTNNSKFTNNSNATFENSGTGAVFNNSGTSAVVTNSGTFNNRSGATFQNSGGSVTNSGGKFYNYGESKIVGMNGVATEDSGFYTVADPTGGGNGSSTGGGDSGLIFPTLSDEYSAAVMNNSNRYLYVDINCPSTLDASKSYGVYLTDASNNIITGFGRQVPYSYTDDGSGTTKRITVEIDHIIMDDRDTTAVAERVYLCEYDSNATESERFGTPFAGCALDKPVTYDASPLVADLQSTTSTISANYIAYGTGSDNSEFYTYDIRGYSNAYVYWIAHNEGATRAAHDTLTVSSTSIDVECFTTLEAINSSPKLYVYSITESSEGCTVQRSDAYDMSISSDTSEITWALQTNGALTVNANITSGAEMPDYDSGKNNAPWYSPYKSQITSVTITGTMRNVSKGAFHDLSELTTVTIPVSVTSIGADAFSNCSKLVTINYSGTQNQWGEITKGTNAIPENVTIKCTDS